MEFRIDKSYEKVYVLEDNAYRFLTNFYSLGVTKKTPEKKILDKAEEFYLREE